MMTASIAEEDRGVSSKVQVRRSSDDPDTPRDPAAQPQVVLAKLTFTIHTPARQRVCPTIAQ
jgi:hypothetical protein